VPVERDEIESLIKCGALDEVDGTASARRETTRPARLWRLNLLRAGHPPPSAPQEKWLFPESLRPEPRELFATPVADYTREQRLAYELEILEVCVSGHPLDLIARNGEAWSDELERYRGRRVTLLGWVVTFRHVGTKDYRNMMFLTLEDQRGLYEVVLFPEAYERYGGLVFETRTLRVTGRVEPDGQINCEKMEPVRQ
jgi:DNA polymerase III alpha subunit